MSKVARPPARCVGENFIVRACDKLEEVVRYSLLALTNTLNIRYGKFRFRVFVTNRYNRATSRAIVPLSLKSTLMFGRSSLLLVLPSAFAFDATEHHNVQRNQAVLTSNFL